MRMSRGALVACLVVLASGCVGRNGETDVPRGSRSNQIVAAEIESSLASNAYDLIQSLRPHWLQVRGPQSLANPAAGEVVVYIDGTPAGGPRMLRDIMAANVHEVRYLSATQASARYGIDYSGGAILIATRR